MKEFLDDTRQQHKDFKEQKTVSFDDIQKDKENREMLAADVYARLLKMGQRISDMAFDISIGDINLSEVSKTLTQAKKNNVVIAVTKWISQLEEIMEGIAN